MTTLEERRYWRAQDLHEARRDLRIAGTNLWRARKIGYRPTLLRHFERLVGVALDHLWDVQQEVKELQ